VPNIRHKVLAYITAGTRLLVFQHPHMPTAGIQVPAGTVETGERLEDAVLREAVEETGLYPLELVSHLGDMVREMSDFGRDEIHHRHFCHVRFRGTPAERWRHAERARDDEPGGPPMVFELFWVALPHEVPALIAGHDALLPALCERLCGNSPGRPLQPT
jgi:8-oxo-dGTP pyrophosphatase MutT (NUDIX family)